MHTPSDHTDAGRRAGLSAATRTFVSVAAAHFMVDATTTVWAVFKTLAGLDLAMAGLVATATTICGFGLQPLFGVLADGGHRRRLVLLGCAMAPLTMALGPISLYPAFMHQGRGYALMFVVMAVAMLGSAMFHPPAVGQAGHSRRGQGSTLVALFIACGMGGMASGQLLFSRAWVAADRHTEVLLLPCAAIVAWLWLWFRPDEAASPPRAPRAWHAWRWKQLPPGLLLLWLIQVLVGYGYGALMFLMPEFVAFRGYPRWWVQGGSFALMVAGSALMMVPLGQLADRLGRRRLLRGVLLAGTALYFVVVRAPTLGLAWWVLLMLVSGGVMGSINPLCVSLGQQMAPARRSLVSGMLMGLAWAAASPTSWIAGALAERTAVPTVLTWMGLFFGIAVALGWMLPADRRGGGQGVDQAAETGPSSTRSDT